MIFDEYKLGLTEDWDDNSKKKKKHNTWFFIDPIESDEPDLFVIKPCKAQNKFIMTDKNEIILDELDNYSHDFSLVLKYAD